MKMVFEKSTFLQKHFHHLLRFIVLLNLRGHVVYFLKIIPDNKTLYTISLNVESINTSDEEIISFNKPPLIADETNF